MRIALLGYGKMGKAIESLALAHGHQISHRIGRENHEDLRTLSPETTDVVIEFSEPEAAYSHVMTALQAGLPVVCGTTGWLDKKERVELWLKQNGGAFFYASNFSIGVNLFFRLSRTLAAMMERFPDYDVSMKEIHHIHKKDSPSGTALTLANDILSSLSRKDRWVHAPASSAQELAIESEREGEVPGTHSVRWSSGIDEIELTHTAHSRTGFALGALKVAEWLPGKQGILGMDDYLPI
jgi:4-hydroxy-tetrahydrodipicolinate reductase